MSARSYGQYCGLARALDLVGERWTLLLVRDLAIAPRRFGDLLNGLPGIGTSLLAERLQRLEELGIVERAAPPRPTRGMLYRLTVHGDGLARAIAPLTAWGATHLKSGDSGQEFRPDWLAFTMRSAFKPEAASGIHDCYELRLERDAVLWLTVDDGVLGIFNQKPRSPDFVVVTDIPTLARLGAGTLAPEDALAAGKASFEGDAEAGWRLLHVFGASNLAVDTTGGTSVRKGEGNLVGG